MSSPVALAAPDAVALVQGAGPVPSAQDKTMEAARQFEGLLMGMLFQSMRKTIEPSGLFGGSESARSTYDYLLDQAVADKAASSGHGWGLAKILAASWSQARGVKPGGAPGLNPVSQGVSTKGDDGGAKGPDGPSSRMPGVKG